jgi:hypothetical protein
MTKECILKQVDDQVNILNNNNKYDQNMELTEDEVKKLLSFNNITNIKYYILFNVIFYIFVLI